MQTQSADTSSDAERAQIALLRRATMARRVALAADLSRTVVALSRAGMKRTRPDADEGELERAFLALIYGENLARRARPALARRQRMSEAPSLWAAMTPVVAALEDLGVAYYVGGSVASSAYGMPRATADVDLVADLRAEHAGRLVAALQDAYYIAEEGVREAIERHTSFNAIHLATMLKVDVFVPPVRAFDQEKFRRARPMQLGADDVPHAFAVASPEDVILTKLEWNSTAGGASERQWSDVQGVLKVQAGALDLGYLRHWAGVLGLSEPLERALADAGLAGPAAPPTDPSPQRG